MTEATKPLPLYTRREEVRALKIASLRPASNEFGAPWELSFSETGYPPIEVSNQFMLGYRPAVGGYYVEFGEMPPGYLSEAEFEKMYAAK